MAHNLLYIIYFISALLFIGATQGLATPKTALRGNNFGISGMVLAVFATLLVLPTRNDLGILLFGLLAALVGVFWANKVQITKLAQMIALLNGFGGLSSVLVALAQLVGGKVYSFDLALGITAGGIAFSGSMVAYVKFQAPNFLPDQFVKLRHFITILSFAATIFFWALFAVYHQTNALLMLSAASLVFGFGLTFGVGGADMPIVISLLNSCSGFAASAIGFSFSNIVLIITGAIVGTSGLVLSRKMTKAMNKSVSQVFFGGGQNKQKLAQTNQIAKVSSPADAAFLMQNANLVIIVPGYGMAVSGAQHALKTLAGILENKYHVRVKFAIHPVAGRMPGHMNVLLAEAKIDYDKVFLLDDINPDFETADVAYVVGANDITNPAAKTDPSSPLFGMPVLDVFKAKTVFFVKRSSGAGYSGAQNPLFFAENTMMLYGDAKKVTEEIIADL
ncbi:MAG: NAD(P)(+) transhydrogenase (Re/Si-specific) subunit beta [Alphaproteobacteria bacterium]|nr:NAD(P)(+) transhydrogenase (Re/Si-specific) subunit beta [Alphaproteobacteria bacterium]